MRRTAGWAGHLVPLVALAATLIGTSIARGEDSRPPNVVIIFIDDMGYADIGPFGADAYETPHLDRMAREGRLLTDFYVTAAVCSASRAGLLSGSYNVRVGITGALDHRADHGLHQRERTLAELLGEQGYATACFGKWHLGHHPKFLPTSRGFDEFFGLPYSNDMWPHHPTAGHVYPDLPLLDGATIVNPRVQPHDQQQLTRQLTERAVEFIERHRERPFFLYLPHPMVHVPLYVSDAFRDQSGAGLYGDVVMELDWSVGEILGALRRHELDGETLVVFTSDNGPWLSYGDHGGSAGPLREGKGTEFEGGCRVPTIAWWPGRIPAGTTCDEPAMTIDLLPTIARLTGAELPDYPIDGRDIWPLLAGEPEAVSPHEAYYFYHHNRLHAVRMGHWKLVFPHAYATLGGRPGGTGGQPVPYEWAETELALFDLQRDVGEQRNVIDEHPQVVAAIELLAERAREELGDAASGRVGRGVREPGRIEPGDLRYDWVPGEPLAVEPRVAP